MLIISRGECIFIQAIERGNQLYDTISDQLNTVNLYDLEVVNYFPNLKLRCGTEESHATLQTLQQILETKASNKVIAACIAVLPPDKSVSILFEATGDIWIVDSHSHCNNGPLVNLLPYQCIKSVSRHMDNMCQKYWNSNAVGAETTMLDLVRECSF